MDKMIPLPTCVTAEIAEIAEIAQDAWTFFGVLCDLGRPPR